MKVDILENKDNLLEVEFDNKNLPTALLNVLQKKGIDAYTYEPHPLLETCRLHIESKNPVKDLKSALKEVETAWNEFGDALKAKVGTSKKAAKPKETKKKPAAKKTKKK